VHVTTPPASAHVQPGMVMELNVVSGGTGIFSDPPSVVVTGLRPAFEAVPVYVMTAPARTGSGESEMVTRRSAAALAVTTRPPVFEL
jgi:hypothetical protein